MQNRNRNAFTLIELLTVIAIIGILAGILIPTVGAVRKQANVAASKAQLSNYVNAIQMFKGEYNYYPFAAAQTDNGANVNSLPAAQDFIETLSGKDPSNGNSVTTGGNRRSIAFHSFSESELLPVSEGGSLTNPIVVDRFLNSNVFFVIDDDGDDVVTVPNTTGSDTQTVRSPVTAYVTGGGTTGVAAGAPAYSLYE